MKSKTQVKVERRERRHARIRSRVFGTEARPRFAVFKSNTGIYAQIINDEKGVTLASSSTKTVSGKTIKDKAVALGKDIAEKAKAKNISKVVFDRGGFIFTGNIKALAESARESGLAF